MSALPAIQVPTLIIAKEKTYSDPEKAASVVSRIPNAKMVTIPGSEGVVWFDDPEPLVAAIESFLGVQAPPVAGDRVLATVLFTDVVDSTAEAARVGDANWSNLLGEHIERARAEIDRYHGRFIDSAGDGLFALFDGPARAVRCAQSIGQSVHDLGLEIRASCHTGEVEIHGDSARGITVHTGARIASLAGPSEVLVSSTVRDLTPGSGLEFKDAGMHELKGVPDRWRLYRLSPTDP
jgi:class 3 adenylate cyclase